MYQFIRFGIVGTLGFLVDACSLLILVHLLNWDPYLARVLAFIPASATTWYCNRHFTFSPHPTKRAIYEWLHYVALNGIGAIINFSTYTILLMTNHHWLTLPLIVILAISSIAAMTFNFFVSKHIAFANPKDRLSGATLP